MRVMCLARPYNYRDAIVSGLPLLAAYENKPCSYVQCVQTTDLIKYL